MYTTHHKHTQKVYGKKYIKKYRPMEKSIRRLIHNTASPQSHRPATDPQVGPQHLHKSKCCTACCTNCCTRRRHNNRSSGVRVLSSNSAILQLIVWISVLLYTRTNSCLQLVVRHVVWRVCNKSTCWRLSFSSIWCRHVVQQVNKKSK